jgi:hypothetical protein
VDWLCKFLDVGLKQTVQTETNKTQLCAALSAILVLISAPRDFFDRFLEEFKRIARSPSAENISSSSLHFPSNEQISSYGHHATHLHASHALRWLYCQIYYCAASSNLLSDKPWNNTRLDLLPSQYWN